MLPWQIRPTAGLLHQQRASSQTLEVLLPHELPSKSTRAGAPRDGSCGRQGRRHGSVPKSSRSCKILISPHLSQTCQPSPERTWKTAAPGSCILALFPSRPAGHNLRFGPDAAALWASVRLMGDLPLDQCPHADRYAVLCSLFAWEKSCEEGNPPTSGSWMPCWTEVGFRPRICKTPRSRLSKRSSAVRWSSRTASGMEKRSTSKGNRPSRACCGLRAKIVHGATRATASGMCSVLGSNTQGSGPKSSFRTSWTWTGSSP